MSNQVSEAIKRFYKAFGGQYPPKASFEGWPMTILIYKHTCLKSPEKLHNSNIPSLFRNWMQEELSQVRKIVLKKQKG